MYRETNCLFTGSLGNICKILMVFAAFLMVTACSKKDSQEKASQSIVRVNGDDITVLQLNNELQRANVQASGNSEVEIQITQKLLERQMLVQEALKSKLDRNPRVMQAIENAKMQVLAQAYLENKMTSLAKPTKAEISNYYNNNAEIFANRKVFVMDDVVFTSEPAYSEELKSLSGSAKTMDDVTEWLDTHQIKFERTQASYAAETIPPELLAKLSKMITEDIIFINNNGRTAVGRMLEVKSVPINNQDASPIIERMLISQKNKLTAETEIARLRRAAKIEYINKKFEPIETDTKTKHVNGESHIEKGLSGL